jgi:uncharacterized RDD family membrane protein YckC/Tfp pilus assembly major pilin PilA
MPAMRRNSRTLAAGARYGPGAEDCERRTAVSEYWIARQGDQHGPFPEDQVRRNYASGRVLPSDLVWTQGMADWKAASQVFGAAPARATAPAQPAPTPYKPPAAVLRDEGDSDLGRAVTYAGFWVRFGAVIIDTIIVYIIAFVTGAVVGPRFAAAGGPGWVTGVAMICGIIGAFLYFTLMESSERGATLGKRAFHLRVVTVGGNERISFARAIGRYFARFISIIVLYVGYLMQPFTRRKQALHDLICGTAVVALAPASRILLGLAIAFGLLIPVAGILAAISIPAYQDYTARARVAEALISASPARTAVNAYIIEHDAIPRTLAEAGVQFPPTQHVQSIAIDPRNAKLTVTLAFSPLAGKTILLVPRRAQDKGITWNCQPGTVPRKYLPASCRNG